MRMSRSLGSVVALAVLASSAATEAKAGYIIGNIPPTYTSPTYNVNGQVNTGLGLNYAVEFTATAAETVTTATLVLNIQRGTTPTLGIYNATPGGTIGSLVGTAFTDSGLTFGTGVTETFTGSASLVAGNHYFLVLDGNAYFNWSATFSGADPSGLTPTGPGATYIAAGSSGSYAAGNTRPSFELDAAAVPEPGSMILSGIGGVVLLAAHRSRKRKTLTTA